MVAPSSPFVTRCVRVICHTCACVCVSLPELERRTEVSEVRRPLASHGKCI